MSRSDVVRRVLTGTVFFVLSARAVLPAEDQKADRVQALVERAAAHIQAVGQARAFTDITNGAFTDGDLYVFCVRADGTVLAHGGNPKLVGKNLAPLRDAEGKLPTIETLRVGQMQAHGWVEYLWPNAATNRVQHKMTYVMRIDNATVCGGGYYKPDPA